MNAVGNVLSWIMGAGDVCDGHEHAGTNPIIRKGQIGAPCYTGLENR